MREEKGKKGWLLLPPSSSSSFFLLLPPPLRPKALPSLISEIQAKVFFLRKLIHKKESSRSTPYKQEKQKGKLEGEASFFLFTRVPSIKKNQARGCKYPLTCGTSSSCVFP